MRRSYGQSIVRQVYDGQRIFVIEHVHFDERFLMVVSDSSDPPFSTNT